MSESARQRANDEQRRASDPDVSAFVGASAGSGKTTLLIARLLRLMLAGAEPGRILCLTYTRAAAAEMAVRLQQRLGRWVTLSDAGLDADLERLGVTPGEANRTRARRLFATVLDLPGGMRIATIHAFCQSLLRRFPLEARLSPHFRLMEETDARAALADAAEAMLARVEADGLREPMRLLAGEVTLDGFAGLIGDLLQHRKKLEAAAPARDWAALAARQRRALGVREPDEAALMARAVRPADEARLRDALAVMAAQGASKAKERAERLLAWLSLSDASRVLAWDAWRGDFLKDGGEPYADSTLVNIKLSGQRPDVLEAMRAEAARLVAIDEDRRALAVADLSLALIRLAAPVLDAYGEEKSAAALLDYNDLIDRSEGLLRDPGVAWVLYKLDGGIDHVLLDEVQDTAPEQWAIAHALTGDFFSGEGAERQAGGPDRTVFAVGDRKQSIYSFQGARAETFDGERRRLARRVRDGGRPFLDGQLDVSFRSTGPVLALVDAVFADPEAAKGVETPDTLRHIADRAGQAGSVELWPLAPVPEADGLDEQAPVPDRNRKQVSAPQRLADALADWIARQTDGSVMLESQGRPVAPGDILVLVRKRDAFANGLLKALKKRGVPVGGLDRLMLTDQPAVQDLMALGDALLLPEDDLTFANLLTSPLGGLSDDSLMALSVGRQGTLWEALAARAGERPDWQRARDFFAALLRRVDHVTPYALFAEALGPLGGRARLFARLGPEAAEPIDELLGAALTHQETEPPALQGFLHWLRRSGAEVKREQEAAGGVVRIMTVHGAKGQEARIVVLPDTTSLPPKARARIDWAAETEAGPKVPLWSPRKARHCEAILKLRQEARERDMAEYNRLLYVALTRAQDRLLICGYAGSKTLPEACWYSLVAKGFEALAAQEDPGVAVERAEFGVWPGHAVRLAAPQTVPVVRPPAAAEAGAAPLPGWIGAAPDWCPAAPPAEPDLPLHLAPSRPQDATLGTVPPSASPLAARDPLGRRFQRGQLIHGLLQHLPALPLADRHAAALAWLDRPGLDLPAEALAAEVMAVLDHPDLAPLFGPDSRAEVPLTGVVGGAVVGGLVDRLAVRPDTVLVADYKTNREPPVDPAGTPVLYLRQMAAYRAVLRGIFPGRRVRCALVWTQAARVVMLDDEVLDPHDPSARPAPPPRASRAG